MMNSICYFFSLYSTETISKQFFELWKLIFSQFVNIMLLNFYFFCASVVQLSLKSVYSIFFSWWLMGQIISSSWFHAVSLRIIGWSWLNWCTRRNLTTNRSIVLNWMWALWHFRLCKASRNTLMWLISFH